MKINRIFDSIQGEGINIGEPSLFIRVHGCNLNCPWCDTKYARLGEEFENFDSYDQIDVLSKQINDYLESKPNIEKIVITGGEPLLYVDDIVSVLGQIKKNLHFETNGLLLPDIELDFLKQFRDRTLHFSISPKLDEKSYNEEIDFGKIITKYNKVLQTMNSYLLPKVSYDLKFVFHPDLEAKINEFLICNKKELPSNIFVMPFTPQESTNKEAFEDEFNKIKLDTVNYCKRMGFKYSPRLQIDLFNDDRDENT